MITTLSLASLPAGLSRRDLDAAFEAVGDGPLIIGLSGGGDSTALLHLLAAHQPRAGALVACVVDHGVREGSAEEAARAAETARAMGVDAQVVHLAWDEGEKRAQAHLRAARYRALCGFARTQRARAIALGHTRDDQAETMLMRAARQTNGAPAAMRALWPAPIWPDGRGLLIARPLLGVRRAALRDWLTARGATWIDDPSNENTVFERVRARAALATGMADGAALIAQAELEAQRIEAANAAAQDWISAAATLERGRARVRLGAAAADAETRGLGALIAAIGGADWLPAADKTARLAGAARDAAFRGATLGGARVWRAGTDEIWIGRDPGDVFGRGGALGLQWQKLAPNQHIVWDGRVQAEGLRAAPEGLEIGPDPARRNAEEPYLRPGGEAPVSLAEAETLGLVAAKWLIEARISHLLFTPR